jgi:hypothetical protein
VITDVSEYRVASFIREKIMRRYVPPNLLSLQEPHGVISQKTIFYMYRLYAMKHPEFGDAIKIGRLYFHVLRVSCVLQAFKLTPKSLGYLKGHC